MIKMVICVNQECPMKNNCIRHRTNIADDSVNMFTSYAYFENISDTQCNFFIDDKIIDEDFERMKNLSC